MQNIEKKQDYGKRTKKKKFTISREIASRKLSSSNIFSEDSKSRLMISSKHSASSIKSKNKINVSRNKDIQDQSLSESSDSDSKNSSRQSIIINDNILAPLSNQSSFQIFQDKLLMPMISQDQDGFNPLDMSDGLERSILKIQFMDFEHRWGIKQDVNMQKQLQGDQMLNSVASEQMSSYRSLKLSLKQSLRKSIKNSHHDVSLKQKNRMMLEGEISFEQESEQENDNDEFQTEGKEENEQNEKKVGVIQEIKRKHQKLYERNPFEDPYYIKLVDLHGFQRLNYEIENYQDDKQYLEFRKKLVYYSLFIPLVCQNIVNSLLFKIIMSFLIIFNVTLYIYSQTMLTNVSTRPIEIGIMICFVIEICLRIIAAGVIISDNAFFKNYQSIFDFILVVVYALNLQYPDIFVVDVSPLRVITLLIYLGAIFEGLGVMLKALKQSFKFLLEALMIVGLFSLFFAIAGVLLFQGLFNYRCQFDNGDETDGWIQCNQNECFEEGMSCRYTPDTPKYPTSFNSVIFSYGQVLRTITMDDWSTVMYFTIRIFHPWIWIYYVLIIFICGFFGFNLVIAVIKTHYAEASSEYEEEKLEKQREERIKENKEIIERDIINVFDVAFLRYIEFFPVIQRYRVALKTPFRSIKIEDNNNERQINNNTKQKEPRLLSAKQKSNEMEEDIKKIGIWKKCVKFLQNFTIKNILLPKFLILKEKQRQIKLEKYTEDETELLILNKLKKFEFCQMQNQVNGQIQQEFTSQNDILPSENFINYDKKEKEKEILNFRQIKLIVKYPEIKEKQKSKKNFQHIRSFFPMKKSQRLKLSQTESDGNDTDPLNSFYKTMQKQSIGSKSLKKSRMIEEEQVPFNIIKQNKLFLNIQGYYLDFDQLKQKINSKIPKNKNHDPSNEFLYLLFRRKEQQKNQILTKTWSGNDILEFNEKRKQNFYSIFKSLNFIDKQIWMMGINGKFKSLQKHIYRIITSQICQLFFDLIVLINFTFLALQGIADSNLIAQEEDISTIFLCTELVLRFFAFPILELTSNLDYMVQTCIVILNFIELTMSSVMTSLDDQSLRLIRGTKCLLFYRVLKYNKMAVAIGHIAQRTFKQYIYLTFLMILVIFIYGMIGMEMYAGEFDQTDSLGQLHSYDNILKACMTIFNIMTNDDWYGVYWMGGDVNYNFGVIYSYSMVILLNYITYGLVMAILLDGFGAIDKELNEQDNQDNQDDNIEIETQEDKKTTKENEEQQQVQFNLNPLVSTQLENQKKSKQHLIINLIESIKQIKKDILKDYPGLYDNISCEQSLYIFEKSNYFRIFCCRIVTSSIFSYFKDILLYYSIIVFILKSYHDYEQNSDDYPDLLQLIANILFALELIIGCIAKGMWMNKGAYITYTWQIVDLVYIIIYFFAYTEGINTARPILRFFLYLGYFRVMKLMYLITWLDTVRLALGRSLADIWNVLLTMLSVWVIFGVYGIILYEQQFQYCDDKMQFEVTKQECEMNNGTWINYKHNFDNITFAIPTLFIVSTFDGWGEIWQVAENSILTPLGPQAFNCYIYTDLFFFIFCFIGSMFFLSLFTGVLFSNLKTNQKQIEQQDLTKPQLEFVEITSIIIKDFPTYSSPPASTIRKIASQITNSITVQKFMFCLLVVDLIVLLLFFSTMSDEFFNAINNFHNVLTYIYILWIILLFLALGINRFFDNYWRRFYFFQIIIALIDIIADYESNWALTYFRSSPADYGYQLVRIFFALRCLRIILIFQGLLNLQRLMRVMAFALPFLGKIFSLLMIAMLIFALIGCQLYGHLDKGQVMDDQINFQNVAQALLALFKCASGDDWRTIMTDTMHYNPYCSEDDLYCGSLLNQIYFFLFMLLSNYVLLNLFVLGLVEQFEQFFQLQNSMIQTYVENIDKIKTVWCKYSQDTQGQAMHYKFLCKFLLDIGKPLGGGRDENLWDVGKIASQFKLQCDHFGYIQYNQLMYELFRVGFHVEVFKEGTELSIKKIKQFNKETQLRIMYYRRNRYMQRSNISPILNLKANFNILHDYLTVLILYQAWVAYSKKLIKKLRIKQYQFSENDIEEPDSSVDNTMNGYVDQDCNDFLEDDPQQVFSNRDEQDEKKHQITESSEKYKEQRIPVYNWKDEEDKQCYKNTAKVTPISSQKHLLF